jgi:L-threonylcarbamoyladenylate synthase
MQDDFKKCISVLHAGGVILYPTDTIWGLGCDATNQAAVEHVYEIKDRPDGKAMILLCGSWNIVDEYFGSDDDLEKESLQYLDRPTTFVFTPKKNHYPWLLSAEGMVAVRVTEEEYSADLCNEFGKPIISTSANLSGKPAPASFTDIDEQIVKAVDYAVIRRRLEMNRNTASRIIKVENGKFEILRD